ncbi:uncharacterized protein LOC108668963 [Hyalella azteca]|uniref:Uncharacterized protein LOC108668963 n=1 Tax=Hyalella azteca TaxID=294128 RepID=A0A8B7NDQ4_HYAAZ|nr:uncharacterized protein LOC108668963 [Hyalella azteca]
MHTTPVNCAKMFTKKTYGGKSFPGPGGRYAQPFGGYPTTGRGPTLLPFPFVPIRDLKLKDRVSGKFDQETNTKCLHEMAVLLACYKKHDFAQAPCAVEATSLTNCHNKIREEIVTRKAKEKVGDMNPGAKRLNRRQVNSLLQRYPQKIDEEVYGKPRN